MGGDRRKTSNSIEVPLTQTPLNNPRKRPPSHIHDFNGDQCNEQEEMNECNAALILMKLSNSPKSPNNGDKWLGSSPGSSSASWSSGSSSPPLSDDGHAINTSVMLNDATARIRTTSVSTSDEGIVVDFKEDAPRKKRANKSRFVCTWKGCKFIELTPPKIERHIRNVHLGNKKARRSADYDGSFSESDHEEEFYYTEIEDDDDEGKAPSPTSPPTLSHRDMARPPHEDPEYQRQIVGNFKQGRNTNQQYQLQNQNNSKSIHHGSSYVNSSCNSNNGYHQQLQNSCLPASPLAHHNYTWPSNTAPVTASAAAATGATSTSYNSSAAASSHHHQQQQHSPVSPLIKHARSSPRPSLLTAPYTYVHHHNYSNPSPNNNKNNCSSNSSNGNSPIIHSNSNANDVLQQLSQQNVTVTAHQSVNHHAVAAVAAAATATVHNSHQQQHQLSAVTIVPNYNSHQQQQQQHHHHHPQQQHIRDGHQQQPTASPTSATASNIVAIHTASPAHFQQQQHSHVAMQNSLATAKHTPNSPNRRTRGENKKCRKVYGMERRSEWCTQCRWKKACSRFGD